MIKKHKDLIFILSMVLIVVLCIVTLYQIHKVKQDIAYIASYFENADTIELEYIDNE